MSHVNQESVFVKEGKGSYRSFNGWFWEEFRLYKPIEIVRQSNDPNFTQLGWGKLAKNDDFMQIKALAFTDTITSYN